MTSFFIQTFGCSHNFAESERMAGLLEQAKFQKVEEIEQADIIIYNTCTVKGPTANSFFTRLERTKQNHPYKSIIIAGCIPQSEPEKLKNYSLLGPRQLHKIVEVVEETINDNIVHNLETGEMPPLNLPKIRKNQFIEIIPISLGCLSTCSFCKTKHARGNLQSYPIEDILQVAKAAIQDGIKENWLTSQDTMCYGFDLKTNLPNLLKELIKLEGNYTIRVGMGNPVHLKRIKEELIPLFNHPRIFKFIHLPMQAGSDTVLKSMKRGNTNQEFLDLVKYIKNAVPDITLATDIIVGYPTESEDDFSQTITTVRTTTPDIINISRFWPRPKTPAAKLKQIEPEIVKKRTRILTDIFENIAKIQNEQWRDWQGPITITEKGKFENQWTGRNFAYKPVIVEGNYQLGQTLNVRITKTMTYDLRAQVIPISEIQ